MNGEAIRTTLGIAITVAVVGAFVYRWLRWTRTAQRAAGSWKHTFAAWTSLPRRPEANMSARRAVLLFGPPIFLAALAWGLIAEPGPWWHRALGVLAGLAALSYAGLVLAYFQRPVDTADLASSTDESAR